MAESDSGTVYPAREFELRGVAQDVTHTSGGTAVTKEAIVNVETVTFLERGSTRKVSTATVTFLQAAGVTTSDTITLPGGQPRAVLKVTSSYAPYWSPRGFLTEVLLA